MILVQGVRNLGLVVMTTPKAILVVGDDPTIHELITNTLSSSEWTVERSSDSLDALTRVERQPYDLILTGVRTSGLDDVELLRQIRQVRPHTKLIVMTADSTPTAVIEAIRAHAFSYFSKPFSPRGLLEMIDRALKAPAWDDGIDVLSARPEWITLRVQCKKITAERLLQFMNEMKADLPVQERENIGTAFREMLLNAVEHGGHFDPMKKVDITYLRTSRVILYHIRDPGEGFTFDWLPHAAVSSPPEAPFNHIAYRSEHGMRAGGFGILLARGLVDELIHNEKGNEVVLIKYLEKESK